MNSLYGSKSVSYLGCKVWEEIPNNLKKQDYLIAFQSGLKMYYSKINQTIVNLNFLFYIVSNKMTSWLLGFYSLFLFLRLINVV